MYRCCTTTGRLDTVEHGTHTATYGYKANTNLLASTTYSGSPTEALTITRNWDNLNRLESITNAPSATSPADMSFTYSYNDLNQRTEKDLESGDKWVYDYDSFGQVTSAHKEDSTEALWPGYDFGYTFDDIGNRLTVVQNGETSTYTPTLVNQYTQRTIPGVTQIRGQADSSAVVTVNTESVIRKDDYFFKKLTVDNSIHSIWESVTVRGVLAEAGRDDTDAIAEEELGRWVPKTPEAFNYDDDGNLTQDGRWDYTWNGENRLVAMETRSVAYTAGAPRERLEFVYDSQGRRVQKTHLVWDEVEAAFVEKSRDLFLYDGWNLLAELRAVDGAADPAMHRRYAWGMDLSGSLQGAGGVGGLVMIILADETVLYPAYDGNGNVMGLFDPSEDDWAAEFEYGAFGEPLRATGPLADANPFRFSTKYTDAETELVYYGFRYYAPETGRWLNRDPIGEEGGVNLYGFIYNNAISHWDNLGLRGFPGVPVGVTGGNIEGWARANTARTPNYNSAGGSGTVPAFLGSLMDLIPSGTRGSISKTYSRTIFTKGVVNVALVASFTGAVTECCDSKGFKGVMAVGSISVGIGGGLGPGGASAGPGRGTGSPGGSTSGSIGFNEQMPKCKTDFEVIYDLSIQATACSLSRSSLKQGVVNFAYGHGCTETRPG